MTTGNAPTHTCSYFCDKPECIKAQRDELRDKLAAIESQPVPVEPPEVARIHELASRGYPEANIESLYIKDLQSALKRAQEERDKWMSLAQANQKLAETAHRRANREQRFKEKAESINRRMVELMKEPSEGMIAAGYPPNDERAQSWDVTEVFKAMSDELLKEVEK